MQRLIWKVRMVLFVAASLSVLCMQAQSYLSVIDSLKQELVKLEDSPEKVQLLNDISYNYVRLNGDSLLLYAEKAYDLSLHIEDKQGQVIALKNLFSGHIVKGTPYDSLLVFYRTSVELAAEIEDYRTISVWNNNLAFTFRAQEDYFTALKFFLRALEVFDEHIDTPDKFRALILGNIGQTFFLQGNYEEAKSYTEAAINYAEKHGFEGAAVMHIDELAKIQYYLGEKKIALSNFEEGLKRQRAIGDKQSEIHTLINQHEVLKEDNPKAAKQSLLIAYELAKSTKRKGYELSILAHLSDLALAQQQIDEAMQYAQKAAQIGENRKRKSQKKQALEALQKVYTQKKDYELFFLTEQKINKLEQEIEETLGQKRQNIAIYYDRQNQIDKAYYQKEQSELKYRTTLYLLFGTGIALAWIMYLLYRSLVNGRKLKIAQEEALAASKAKQDFLSVMSHEIRTPMNAVIGFTDILIEDNPKPQHITFLNSLKSAGEQLMQLINDVLDLSKLNADKIELESIPFDLNTQLKNNIEIFKTVKKNDEVTIHFEWIGTILKTQVIGDPVRLNQILTNLIGNAMKFTHEGKITLQVQAHSPSNNKQRFSFKVIDTGIGIPIEKQQTIFEDFIQVSNATSREYGGTGLGLSITQQLVELHDSQIQLESEEGKGSIFSFDITYELGEALSPSITRIPEQLASFENLSVLVAEDNVFNQKVVQNILQRFGAKVTMVSNGIEAIEKTKTEDVHIILMDLHMPKMDGIQAIKEIRQLPSSKRNIPIVVLTAEVLDENDSRLSELEVTYVSKPFQASQLYNAIKNALLLPVSDLS